MNLAPAILTRFDRAFEKPAETGFLVTVTVSLYNYAGVVEACLDSVAAQTHGPLEIVVVDDCSTDGSAEVAERWLDRHADRFTRARLLQPSANGGLSRARNAAFEAAAAEFVFVLDADNVLLPRAIGRLVEALAGSDAAFAYSQLVFFQDGEGLGAADMWNPDFLKKDNYIDAMSLVRKAAWRAVGGYARMEYGWEDYDFWCKLAEQGLSGLFVPELLCRYRVHHTSMLRNDTAAQRRRLIEAMMARHPWLELQPKRATAEPVRGERWADSSRRPISADEPPVGRCPSRRLVTWGPYLTSARKRLTRVPRRGRRPLAAPHRCRARPSR